MAANPAGGAVGAGGAGPIWRPGSVCGAAGRGAEGWREDGWRDPNLLPGDIAEWPSAPPGSALRAPGTTGAMGTTGAVGNLGPPETAPGSALSQEGWEEAGWGAPQGGSEGRQATAAFGGAVGGAVGGAYAAPAPGTDGVITSHPSADALSGFGFDLASLRPPRASPHLTKAEPYLDPNLPHHPAISPHLAASATPRLPGAFLGGGDHPRGDAAGGGDNQLPGPLFAQSCGQPNAWGGGSQPNAWGGGGQPNAWVITSFHPPPTTTTTTHTHTFHTHIMTYAHTPRTHHGHWCSSYIALARHHQASASP